MSMTPEQARILELEEQRKELVEAMKYLLMHQPGTVAFDTYWPINAAAAWALISRLEGE